MKQCLSPAAILVETINRVYKKQLTTTSGGNLSILDEDGNIWITPSGIDKGSLTEADICKVLPDGTQQGKHRPSCELPFHRLVYATRKDVRAVLHAHPPALVSFSLVRTLPDVSLLPAARRILGDIGIAAYEVPGSIRLGEYIAAEFKKGINVVLMYNHGAVTCGKTMLQALERFETFEYAANLDLAARALGTAHAPEQILCDALGGGSAAAGAIADCDAEETLLRETLCALTARSYAQGLFTCTQGAFSAKLSDDVFLFTPENGDRSRFAPADILKIDIKQGALSPAERLHAAIYAQHPRVSAVAAAMPPHIMGFGVTGTPLDSRTIPESYIMMRDLVRLPGIAANNPETLAARLSARTPVLLVENGGVVATGETPIQAFDRLEVAEFTAKTTILSRSLGKIVPITEEEVRTIQQDFHLQ